MTILIIIFGLSGSLFPFPDRAMLARQSLLIHTLAHVSNQIIFVLLSLGHKSVREISASAFGSYQFAVQII